jgi:hypothetical protein
MSARQSVARRTRRFVGHAVHSVTARRHPVAAQPVASTLPFTQLAEPLGQVEQLKLTVRDRLQAAPCTNSVSDPDLYEGQDLDNPEVMWLFRHTKDKKVSDLRLDRPTPL